MSSLRTATAALLLAVPLGAGAHPGHTHAHAQDAQPSNDTAASPWWPAGATPERRADPNWLKTLLQPPPRATGRTRLDRVAADARHVVLAHAAGHELHDDGRLRLTRLHVDRQLRGDVGEHDIRLADIAGALRRDPLPLNRPLLLLLDPAPDYSYLRGHGEGLFVHHHPGWPGVVLDTADQAIAVVDWLSLPADASPLQHFSALLAVLADGHDALSREALLAMRELQPPPRLDATARAHIGKVLSGTHPSRLALADLLADWQHTDTAELITIDDDDPPEEVARLWLARARLQAEAPPRSLATNWSEDRDAGKRGAASWLLALRADDEALAAVEGLLLDDPAPAVRRAAIEALRLLPAARTAQRRDLLRAAFDTPERELRQAVARQLLADNREAAIVLLTGIVTDGHHRAAREDAARLLVTRIGVEDPRAKMLAYVVDGAELRRILSEGVVRSQVLHLHGEGHAHGLMPPRAGGNRWQWSPAALRTSQGGGER